MKIALLSAMDGNGGAAVSAWRLLESLRQNGLEASMLVQTKHQVSPWSISVAENTAWNPWLALRELVVNGWIASQRTPLTNTIFGCPQWGIDLAGHPMVEAADIVNLHWVESGFQSVGTIERLGALGKPVVWTLHDMAPLTGGCHYSAGCHGFETTCSACPQLQSSLHFLPERVLALKRKAWGGFPFYAIAPSRWLAGLAERSGFFAPGRVRHIPYSLDLEKFAPLDQAGARRELGLDPEMIYLCFGCAHAHERRKGFAELLQAMAFLRENPREAGLPDGCKLGLLAFGDNMQPPVGDHFPIKVFGKLNEERQVRQILGASDFFVCPTLEDNLPNTILEAMACGRPVIAFSTGGVPDMVEEGIHGFLTAPGDIRGLAHAIARACADQAWREKAGRAARAKAEREYAPAVQAARYRACFEEWNTMHPAKPTPASPAPWIGIDERILNLQELGPLLGGKLNEFAQVYHRAVNLLRETEALKTKLRQTEEFIRRQNELLAKERDKASQWEEKFRNVKGNQGGLLP